MSAPKPIGFYVDEAFLAEAREMAEPQPRRIQEPGEGCTQTQGRTYEATRLGLRKALADVMEMTVSEVDALIKADGRRRRMKAKRARNR